MTALITSAAGKAIDLGAEIADKLNEIAEADLVEDLADALTADHPELSELLKAVLPDVEFRTLKAFLKRAAESLSPGEHLRLLAGPVADIPAKGIPWTWKAARQASLPASGALTLSLKGSGQASVRILPGPGYEFKGALGTAGGLKAPFSFGGVSVSGRRSRRDRLVVKFAHPEDTRVLEALRLDLPVIALLNDPESLLDAEKFKSLRLTTTGSVRLGAGMKISPSWVHAFDAGGVALATRLKADVSYQLDWVKTGSFGVSVSRARRGQLRLRLTESHKTRHARSLSVGAEVGIRGLRKSVAALMEEVAAEPVLGPLTESLADYRAMQERIANAVEATEKERLAVRYGRSVTASGTEAALLKFRLNPREKGAREFYRQMLTGDFTAAMTAGMHGDNAAIVLEDSVFKRLFERKITSGLTFNFPRFKIASRRALSTKLKVERGAGGQINILDAEGQVSETHVAFGEGQSMRVGSLLHFVTSPDAHDAFAVQLDYTDENMKPEELRQYIESLEDAGLVARGATQRIAELDATLGVTDRRRRPLRIDTALALSRDELLEAGNTDEDEIIRVAIEEQLKSYGRLGWADRALGRLADVTDGDVASRLFDWRDCPRWRIRRDLGIAGTRRSRAERHVLYLVYGILERADELTSFIAHWRELDRIGRSVADNAERLDEARLAELRGLHDDAMADLSAWVDARGWAVGLAREDLSPIAAAFVASLRRLSPRAAEPLIPVISWTGDGDTRRVAVV